MTFFKYIRPILSLFVFIASSQSLTAGDIKTKSVITAVTVYTDQALVSRVAKENVPAGIHNIIITDLPAQMVDQSLKVTGISDNESKISDIKIEQLFLDTIPASRIGELYQRLNVLRNEKNTLERTSVLYNSQIDAVEALRDNYTKGLSNPNAGQKTSIEDWEKLLQFIEKKKIEFSGKMETLRHEVEAKEMKIKAIENEIRANGSAAKKEEKRVVVTLNASKAGSVTLEISYLTYNASWQPIYEARVTSSEKSLQLVYSGYVKQSSSEDWNNIDLTLSTARPSRNSSTPKLNRWTVDVASIPSSSSLFLRGGRSSEQPMPRPSKSEITFNGNTLTGRVVDNQTGEPIVGVSVVVLGTTFGGVSNLNGEFSIYNIRDGKYNVRASMIGYQSVLVADVMISASRGAQQTIYLSPSNVELNEVVITSERPIVNRNMTSSSAISIDGASMVKIEESSSSSQMTSSIFAIPSKQTIPSDNKDHKVGISIENIPIDFMYDVAPKLMQSAFLTGKGKNIRDYPLLSGNANVFLDNSFITTIPLNTIMPNDSFSVNLGVDEGIRVERKMINRFKETVGTFTSKTRITFEFENTVTNHKKYPVEIVLSDQVPVVRDEQITVEVIEPSSKTQTPNADGIFIWKAVLQAGEKKIVKLKFAVEFPPGLYPYGLE